MTSVVSSNPEVVAVFSEMKEAIVKEGGFFHPDACIIEENGNIIVESSLEQNEKDVIFSVPVSCLFDINDFAITLNGNKLILSDCRDNATDLHKKMCELMLNLFNLTNKITYHKKTFPLPLLNNPEIFNLVEKKCPGICAKHKKYNKELSDDQVLVKTFLGCRYLNVNIANWNNAQVIMPVIDSLNHHLNSPGIDIVYNLPGSTGSLQARHSKPLVDTGECFINYGPMDPMPRYFRFGFIDVMPYYLQSIPLVVDLQSIGKIIINPFNVNQNDTLITLPDKLENIKTFFPNIVRRDRDFLVWRLFIPIGSTPHALRSILGGMIVSLAGKKIKPKKLEKYIKEVEIVIVKKNRAYFEEMLALAVSGRIVGVPPVMVKEFEKLANLQLKLLIGYQQKVDKLSPSYWCSAEVSRVWSEAFR